MSWYRSNCGFLKLSKCKKAQLLLYQLNNIYKITHIYLYIFKNKKICCLKRQKQEAFVWYFIEYFNVSTWKVRLITIKGESQYWKEELESTFFSKIVKVVSFQSFKFIFKNIFLGNDLSDVQSECLRLNETNFVTKRL